VRAAEGEVLTVSKVGVINTFDHPDTVVPRPFRATAVDRSLTLSLAPRSVTVVHLDTIQ
jgi:alpha-N-arabinofuranosidase